MIPRPPVYLIEAMEPKFVGAPDLEEWVRENILFPGGVLENPDHAHLQQARLGFMWTNLENRRGGKRIIGQCRLMPPSGDKWSAGLNAATIAMMFDGLPDFLIILDGVAYEEMDDWQRCALIEHELYHAAQKRDEFGEPMFQKETGQPVWAIKGHDVEEFVGVVQRYGATSPELAQMVQAVNRGPEIAATNISRACATCLRIVK